MTSDTDQFATTDKHSGRRPVKYQFAGFLVDLNGQNVSYNGHQLEVGGRAFDILVALLERSGQVVSQELLISRAWPKLFVEEANLRVNIASLRKLFRENGADTEYIKTVQRRGYLFTEPVEIINQESLLTSTKSNLPKFLSKLIGRESEVSAVRELLLKKRFVSITGPGGVGKTSLALNIAKSLDEKIYGDVCFVDLALVTRGDFIETALVSSLGISLRGQNAVASMVSHLKDKQTLILLDNCEHLLDDVSFILRKLFREIPQLFLLTTSREAIKVEGEEVFTLGSLKLPPQEPDLTAKEITKWPAVQLFMERAISSGYRRELSDNDAKLAAKICESVDGNALAIELAGSRVGQHGIDGTSILINSKKNIQLTGRRDAINRHQSLKAMVEWSFLLLERRDRMVIVRLSIFVGAFTLNAAKKVICDDLLSEDDVELSIASLCDKSLISRANGVIEGGYRLLITTLRYVSEKLSESGEMQTIEIKHRQYLIAVLARSKNDGYERSSVVSHDLEDVLGNISASIESSLQDNSTQAYVSKLVALTTPVLLRRSMLKECLNWTQQALNCLAADERNTDVELALWEGLAVSVMFTKGNSQQTLESINKGIELARELDSFEAELRLLAGLHIYKSRTGEFQELMGISEQAIRVSDKIHSDYFTAMAEWMMGVATHLCGDQTLAHEYCEKAMRRSTAETFYLDAFGFDHLTRGLIVLARVLWLRGFPSKAEQVCKEAIRVAESRDYGVALCIALMSTTTVSLWSGDISTATIRITRLIKNAKEFSLEPYLAVGVSMRGYLAVLKGDPRIGIDDLRRGLNTLSKEQHRVLSTEFLLVLARALSTVNLGDEALSILEEAHQFSRTQGEQYQFAEVCRVRGMIYQANGEPIEQVEQEYRNALAIAQEQRVLGWELRAATSLAKLLILEKRNREASEILEHTINKFGSEVGTLDMKVALNLKDSIQ